MCPLKKLLLYLNFDYSADCAHCKCNGKLSSFCLSSEAYALRSECFIGESNFVFFSLHPFHPPPMRIRQQQKNTLIKSQIKSKNKLFTHAQCSLHPKSLRWSKKKFRLMINLAMAINTLYQRDERKKNKPFRRISNFCNSEKAAKTTTTTK